MRRGGRLILLLGAVLAALVALGVAVFLQQGTPPGTDQAFVEPTSEPTQRIVIARATIPRDTLLTDTVTLLDYTDIPESVFNASPDDYFQDVTELANKVTITEIASTSPVRARDVIDPGLSASIPEAADGQPRTKAYPLQVSNLSGVADEIAIGDFVDVLTSFSVTRTYLRPGFNEEGGIRFVEEQFVGTTTKAIIQNVRVLLVKRPEVAPAGTTTPTAEGQAPAVDDNGVLIEPGTTVDGATNGGGSTITPGSWILLLALTNQQAEILEFSRRTEGASGITLVLRGRGDGTIEDTLGATLDLLVTNFGLPLPQPAVPAVEEETALTPVAATQQPASPTPTP
ncbi:MAG: flagellar biosynthesis protein FlgA [Roseiflexaceae bacterium]|nr:flagellar biosynthesis protein FlgA [Roseiflexaceae bacterium]